MAVVMGLLAILCSRILPGATGLLEAPRFALAGGRMAVRFTFQDEAGKLIADPVSFNLTVNGQGRFAQAPRTGKVFFGGGTGFIRGESEGGAFEIDMDTPAAEILHLRFVETSRVGISMVFQNLFTDGVEGGRRRWTGHALKGPAADWTIAEAAEEDQSGRQGTRAWWSGPLQASADTTLVSTPFSIPVEGKTFFSFFQRYDFESAECMAGGAAHHGAVLEVLHGGQGSSEVWRTVPPSGGYPLAVQSGCKSALNGSPAFGGTSGRRFEAATFDLSSFAVLPARLRLRLAAGCEDCGPREGWFIDDFSLDTTDLSVRVLLPAEDGDGDSVANEREIAQGSDPLAIDTDGDGLLDGVETATGVFIGPQDAGTDPRSPDSDGDGIADGMETELGKDPNDPAAAPKRSPFDLDLSAGNGYRWIIRGDGSAGPSAADPLQEVFTPKGGFRLEQSGKAFPAALEAFQVGDGDQHFSVGPALGGPLKATRRIYVSPDQGFIRYLEIFENASPVPQEVFAGLECAFAQGKWVEVEKSSSGAGSWSVQDAYAHFNDRDPADGMPYLLWFYQEPGGRLQASEAALSRGEALLSFKLELRPGERRALLHFAAQSPELSSSQAVAELIARQDRSAIAGLSPEDGALIANFSLDSDGDGLPDHFELAGGLDPKDPADAAADGDGDGLSALEEFRSDTDPRSADTDGDGLSDGKEVRELKTDPRAADSDRDGIADGSDLYPADALEAQFSDLRYALAGGEAAIEVRIVAHGASFAPAVRFSLRLEGSEAQFAGPAEGGAVLDGLGTAAIAAEVQGGVFRIGIRSTAAGFKKIKLVDTEGFGLQAPASIAEDFELDDGGFSAEGPAQAWKWGEAPKNPGAKSGRKVWSTGLAGSYPPDAFDSLTTPEYSLGAPAPRLSFFSMVAVEEDIDEALLLVSRNGGEFELLDGPYQNSAGYREIFIDLSPYQGEKTRFRFLFLSDFSDQRLGWFIDDFKVEGLRDFAAVEFLNGGEDFDGDGLDNQTEVQRGTDPASEDTDGDGLADPVETSTGRFVNDRDTGTSPTRGDSDQGGERDGEEVAAGRDPTDPFDDQVPAEFLPPLDTIPFTDGGGSEWLATPLGGVFLSKEEIPLLLNVLEVDRDLFFATEEATLGFGRQILILKWEAGFLGEIGATRKLFISKDRPLLRWFDEFENTGDEAMAVRIDFTSIFDGPFQLEGVESGSGDAALDREDEYFIARLTSEAGTAYLGQVFFGPGASVKPLNAALLPGLQTSSYEVPIPAHGKAALLRFAVLAGELEEVKAGLESARRLAPEAWAGLSEEEMDEIANFTADSDGDGLPDGYERKNGLDPKDAADASGDADGDGLSNLEEHRIGTDPRKADTDGDGWSDGLERNGSGTDPLNPDTDGDGLPDGEDSLPLLHIVAWQRDRLFDIAGEEARLKIHLELPGRQALPAAADLAGLTVPVRFGAPVEIARMVAGERVDENDPQADYFHPLGEWIILDVRVAAPGLVPVAIGKQGEPGLTGKEGTVVFLAAAEEADGDGLPNRFEVDHGTDPTLPDTDGDGIGDRFETGSGVVVPAIGIGTFPWTRDSDGGGADDKIEIASGRDPFHADDDPETLPLPVTLNAAGGKWDVLPSWALVGSADAALRLDNAGILKINGQPPPFQTSARVSAGNTGLRLGPARHGGLVIYRRVDALARQPVLRFAEVLSNPGGEPIDVKLEIGFDLAADGEVELESTSSGDPALDRRDRWALLRDQRQRFLHLFFGGGSLEAAELREADLLWETFSFTIPPGEKRSVVHCLALAAQPAALLALAEKLLALEGGALDGLAAEEAQDAINLPPRSPILWSLWPRSPAAPGELISIAGEFLRSDLQVLAGGKPLETVQIFQDRLLFRAPSEPGAYALEARAAAGDPLLFPEILRVEAALGYFRRGDVDGDARADLTDVIRLLFFLFLGEGPPGCMDSADLNDNGKVDLTDAILLLQILYQGKGPIPYPGGAAPGPDPTADEFICQ